MRSGVINSFSTVAASSAGGRSLKTPPYLPTGVRNGSQMTASRKIPLLIVFSFTVVDQVVRDRHIGTASHPAAATHFQDGAVDV